MICARYLLIKIIFSLSQFVTEGNWFNLFGVSKKHSLSRLKSEIRRFVGSNLDIVSDQISFKVNPLFKFKVNSTSNLLFKELSFEDVVWLMPMSTSRNEMVLFEALTGWLRYSVGNRQKYLSSTMALIKFRKVPKITRGSKGVLRKRMEIKLNIYSDDPARITPRSK